MSLLPPPEQDYPTWEELVAAVDAHAEANGYRVNRRRSKKDGKTDLLKKFKLICDRGRDPRIKEIKKRKRDTNSIKCGCPFVATAVYYKSRGVWSLNVVDGTHNHEGLEEDELSAVAAYRTKELTEDKMVEIDNATRQDRTPGEILTSFRLNDPTTRLTAQDIYNAKKKIKSYRLGRHTATQHLLYSLARTKKFFARCEVDDETRRLRRLFFVNNDVKEILCKNSEVLVMDCTYKTNRYGMPLMVIMGHTAIGTSFYIGFAFLEKEEQEDFEWLLDCLRCLYEFYGLMPADVIVTDRDLALMNALRVAYPRAKNLLCLWHVHKNVLKNCKASFAEEDDWLEFLTAWHRVVYAFTENDMLEAWRTLSNTFKADYSADVDYLANTWLNKYRNKICKCYTNKYLHFDTCTTSRVESGHRVLKASLKCSTGDLDTVVSKILTVLMNCYQNYSTKLGQQKRNTPFSVQHSVYRELIGRVSPHALRKINKQYQLVKAATSEEPLSSCTHVFTTTMGLPCAHTIKTRIEEVDGGLGRLHLEDVHPHWRFKKPSSGLNPDPEAFTNDLDYVTLLNPEVDADDDDEPDPLPDDLPSLEELLHGREDSQPNQEVGEVTGEATAGVIGEVTGEVNDADKDESDIDSDDELGLDLERVGNLLDINEPKRVKSKGRPKGAKQKNPVMTRKEKAAARSTKRDPSGFEHTEAAIASQRGGRGRGRGRGQPRGERGGRGGRGGRGRGRGGGGGGGGASQVQQASDSTTTTSRAEQVQGPTTRRRGGGSAARPRTPISSASTTGDTPSAPIDVSSYEESSEESEDHWMYD